MPKLKKPIYKFTLKENYEKTFSSKFFNRLDNSYCPIYFKDRLMGSVTIDTIDIELNKVITIEIMPEYSWDGCTPKYKAGTNVLGIWDGFTSYATEKPKCYYASLIHDFLLQFEDQHNVPNYIINLIFKYQLKEDKFELVHIYYFAVTFYFFIRNIFINKSKVLT